MKKIKLSNGFEFELDEKVANNMELVDALSEDNDNPLTISKICKLMYDEDLRGRLYDSLRNDSGRVPIEKVAEAVKETFEQLGENAKKS